jgi:hypothetical protein
MPSKNPMTGVDSVVSSNGQQLLGPTGALPLTFGTAWFIDPTGDDALSGLSSETPFASAEKALEVFTPGDIIYAAPGQYAITAAVQIAARNSNLIMAGLGGRGSVYFEPEDDAVEGMQVMADDVTLINIGVAGTDGADYAINLNACSRFRAYGCKFEGGAGVLGPTGIIMLVNGTADAQVADALLSDCEFAWSNKGIVFDDSSYGYPTQFFVQNCRFHDLTTQMFGVNTNGLVKGLEVTGCIFDNAEDGTAPTDYILLSDNGNTGLFAGNYFATATNATGVLTIGTGIKWGPNGTEAGWSVARPA